MILFAGWMWMLEFVWVFFDALIIFGLMSCHILQSHLQPLAGKHGIITNNINQIFFFFFNFSLLSDIAYLTPHCNYFYTNENCMLSSTKMID